MIRVLSDGLLEDHLRCHSKSYLRVQGRFGQATAYSNMCAKLNTDHRANAFHWLRTQSSAAGVRSLDGSRLKHLDTGDVLILDGVADAQGLETHFHGHQRVPGKSNLGVYYYQPIRAHRNPQPEFNSAPSAGVRCPCTRSPAGTFTRIWHTHMSSGVQAHPRRSIRLPQIPSQRFLRVFVSRSPAAKNRRLH